MTPERAIAALDKQVAKHGDSLAIYRYGGSPRGKVAEATVKGFVRPLKNDELVGDIKLGDFTIVLSPTGLGSMATVKKDDKVLVAGRELNIELSRPTRMGNTLIRYDLVVRG